MNSDGRSRRRELVEEAYDLQVKAGLMASPSGKVSSLFFTFLYFFFIFRLFKGKKGKKR